jgi:hypothetical protein
MPATTTPRVARLGSGPLWAITSYFNPIGYKRRLENYHVFRRHLTVPLVTVELSFGGGFQLAPQDADILLQLDGGDVLWQKERLLNVAVRAVPPACDKIAWVDCDVIFDSDDWPERAGRALDDRAFVQLFHERHDLPREVHLEERRSWTCATPYLSSMYKITTGQATPEDLARRGILLAHRSSPGLGWAGRRDVLETHGLYDACIAGGADRSFVCAALGKFDAGRRALQMNPRRTEHYLTWARPFFGAVRGGIGCIPGRIFHLWHGDLKDRKYDDRLATLKDFDPFTDIALGAQGCWRWSSDKRGLHADLRRYFEERNEDGYGTS